MAVAARRLTRSLDRATLATAARPGVMETEAGEAGAGWPYPSFVLTAADHDGSPLLFVSGLAQHTRNLLADDRVGLSFEATAGLMEPLTGARVSVLGRAIRTDDARHRGRFLARHPSTQRLTALGDFAFFRVAVERVHLVAGFGRARWLGADLFLSPVSDPAAAVEAETACLARFADRKDGRGSRGAWRLAGVDPDGCDLRSDGGTGGAVARVEFAAGPLPPDDWAVAMVEQSPMSNISVCGNFGNSKC